MPGRRHDPEMERWWATWEHPEYGTVGVCFRWRYLGNGIYDIVETSMQFDVFCPPEEQSRLIEVMRGIKVRSVLRDA